MQGQHFVQFCELTLMRFLTVLHDVLPIIILPTEKNMQLIEALKQKVEDNVTYDIDDFITDVSQTETDPLEKIVNKCFVHTYKFFFSALRDLQLMIQQK